MLNSNLPKTDPENHDQPKNFQMQSITQASDADEKTFDEFAYRRWWEEMCGYSVGKKSAKLGEQNSIALPSVSFRVKSTSQRSLDNMTGSSNNARLAESGVLASRYQSASKLKSREHQSDDSSRQPKVALVSSLRRRGPLLRQQRVKNLGDAFAPSPVASIKGRRRRKPNTNDAAKSDASTHHNDSNKNEHASMMDEGNSQVVPDAHVVQGASVGRTDDRSRGRSMSVGRGRHMSTSRSKSRSRSRSIERVHQGDDDDVRYDEDDMLLGAMTLRDMGDSDDTLHVLHKLRHLIHDSLNESLSFNDMRLDDDPSEGHEREHTYDDDQGKSERQRVDIDTLTREADRVLCDLDKEARRAAHVDYDRDIGDEDTDDVDDSARPSAFTWHTVWSERHKAQGIVVTQGGQSATLAKDEYAYGDGVNVLRHTNASDDATEGKLHGSWRADYGSVRGRDAVAQRGKTYFEVCIEMSGDAAIGEGLGGGYLIGICSHDLINFECSPDRGFRGRKSVWALGDAGNRPRGLIVMGDQKAVPWVVGSGYGHRDVIGVLVDMDVRRLCFYKNGVRIGEPPHHVVPDKVYPLVTLVNKGVKATLHCPGCLPDALYIPYCPMPFFQMTNEVIRNPAQARQRTSRSALEPLPLEMHQIGHTVGPLSPRSMSLRLRYSSPQHVLLRPATAQAMYETLEDKESKKRPMSGKPRDANSTKTSSSLPKSPQKMRQLLWGAVEPEESRSVWSSAALLY